MSKNPLPGAPRSRLAPYSEHEDWAQRHGRRLRVAQNHEHTLRRWVEAHGGQLSLHNNGAHWKIALGHVLVEWWPETGRLVRGQRYHAPLKCHDVHQVIERLSKWVGGQPEVGRKRDQAAGVEEGKDEP